MTEKNSMFKNLLVNEKTCFVKLNFQDNELVLSADTPDSGKSEEKMDITQGKLVIGSWPHEDYPFHYMKNDLMFSNSLIDSINEFMQIKFSKVYLTENKDEENEEIQFSENVELSYDSNLIYADNKYRSYLFNKMSDLINNGDCFTDIIKNFDNYGNFTFIYCKNENNIKNKLNLIIKTIYLFTADFNYTFEITPKEIIKEKNNYIFIQILFRDLSSKWTLGKIFTLKYQFTFNQDSRKIGFYKVSHKNSKYNIKVILIIISIIILSAILIVLGIFIGKYLYKTRKRRANELNDEFDYVEENKNENSINNIFLDN